MNIFRRKSLRTKFALWTFATTGVLIIFVLALYAAFSYRLFFNDYTETMKKQMDGVAVALETMLKETDYLGMIRQSNILLLADGVVGVKVLDVNQNVLMVKGSSKGISLQYPITHDKEQIGSIEVVFSDFFIKDKVRSMFLPAFVVVLVGVPLSALLIWFVSGYLLKDILVLSSEVHRIGDINAENFQLTGMERQDEIGHLARSIADRNHSILEARKQQQLLYYAIDQSHDSVVITDADAKIEYVNPAFTRITGYSQEEATGQNPRILQSGKHGARFYKRMWNTLLQGKAWQGLIINRRKNGEEYQEEATITPVVDGKGVIHHYVAMKRDVTLEVILERKLARAEKMQAIGQMAAGVAHDLNNLLSGIVAYPELLLGQIPEDSQLREPLKAIQDSGNRAAVVVADLLTVARGSAATHEIQDMNDLVEQYLGSPECQSLQSLHPEISIQSQLTGQQILVSCSSVHIKKCLMNLVTNAAESIEGQGIILVSTSIRYLNQQAVSAHALEPGVYVVVSVQDNGSGIAAKDLDHIFEPFYTKKVMGKSGSGLGLAVVWNTVQDHAGMVDVHSNANGTCFELWFPAVNGEVADTREEKQEKAIFSGNGEHILVVDDEPQLRDIASQILSTLGYEVDSVCSGELALQFIQSAPVDLLVIDMLMEPGMSGRKTYEEVIKLYPGQKAIVASGFSESRDVKVMLELGVSSFVKKPYSVSQLGQAVQEALNG
jgi:PAS domain S-box-containing protein